MRYLSTSKPVGVLTLVRSIYKKGQTGTLELETVEGTRRLYFVEGQLYLCRSVSPLAQRIDHYLKDVSTWEASRSDEKMAQLLRMTAEHLASWKVSSYRFAEGFRVDAQELVGPLHTATIVGEPIEAAEDEYSVLLEMVGGLSATLVAKDLATAQLKDSELSRAEMDLLFRFVRPTPVGSLLRAGSDRSLETLRSLSRLCKLGLVGLENSLHIQEPESDDYLQAGQDIEVPEDYLGELSSTRSVPLPERLQEPLGIAGAKPAATKSTSQRSSDRRPAAGSFLVPEPRSAEEKLELDGHESEGWFKSFGLDCKPFSLTPDPAFLFLSESHLEALAGLKLSLMERRGLCVMTGEVGTGKTTLLYSLLSALELNVRTAYVHNPALPFDQLLQVILDDFEVSTTSHRRVDMLKALNDFLLSCARKRETVALILDEAQTLSDSAFEALRLLLNFETFDSKLLQIILVGQPELGKRLESDRLRQIANRVSIRCQLERLTSDEAQQYVLHRLRAANGELEVFSRPALRLIIKKARGVPRTINVICHNAMLYAFGCGERKVHRNLVVEAVRDLSS